MNPVRSFLFATLVLAAHVHSVPHSHSHSRSLHNRPLGAFAADTSNSESVELPFMKGYSEFQISSGYGGTAEEEAAAVFIKPFENIDLASVPYEVFDALKLAKEVAEDIEVEVFERAIERAGEDTDTGRALNVGMWKNRVLFATELEIESAHNKALGLEDPYEEDDLEWARGYLAWTIEADQENIGEPSLGVT